jgi:GT2 family glycosyltransferase
MENKKKLAVIIATFNRCSYLKTILQLLEEQKLPENVDMKMIVVIDGSTDGTNEMIAENFPNIITINSNAAWWWTKSMNAGFKKAIEMEMDYVLILNDDNEIRPDYVATILHDHSSLPEDTILGSASVSIETPTRIESSGTKKFFKLFFKLDSYHNGRPLMDNSFSGIHPSYTLSGRGTLIPTSLFKKIGLYEEKFVQYMSDDDFCLRALKYKIPVYISWNALVYNHTKLTSVGNITHEKKLRVVYKSLFNQYSVNSLKKHYLAYTLHAYPLLAGIYATWMGLSTILLFFMRQLKVK